MFVIPSDRLPPGFAERVEDPPAEPAAPRPAATTVLLRDGTQGPEALLLRRHRRSGFVPGAYVFPGGRVDEADADPRLVARTDGLDDALESLSAYAFAAIRELFEETGVLLARDPSGCWAPDAEHDARVAEWRDALMADRATLLDVAEALELRLSASGLVYFAHWITPIAEPRRYDTRFFLALLPQGRSVTVDAREMTDAVWLPPAAALERFRDGRLPMVFPTVRTLEALCGFESVGDALEAFRGRAVAPMLPRLVRTPEGVGIVVDDPPLPDD